MNNQEIGEAVLGKAAQRALSVLGISDWAPGQGSEQAQLVRLYLALYALVGGDEAKLKSWMRSHNDALSDVPATLVLVPDGLARMLAYLEGGG